MHAPMRNRLSKIGSEPTKVILPPVSFEDRPMLCMKDSNALSILNWVVALFVFITDLLVALFVLITDLPHVTRI
jgi:hypothetical protein